MVIGEIIFIGAAVAIIAVIAYLSYQYYTQVPTSHYDLTDKEILQLIARQADGVISAEILSDNTILSKSDARKRLGLLSNRGVLQAASSRSWPFSTHYVLKQKLLLEDMPDLSSDPFLSMEDLMKLFKHFGYRLTLQHICLATNLPINVIVREMKYFQKQKVVDAVTQAYSEDGMSTTSSLSFYILKGKYRNDPDAYLKEQVKFDLDLSKIYQEHLINRSGE